eukprot:COSAG01_NODE_1283_length_10920_cov_5.539507_8_plen_125_part_00
MAGELTPTAESETQPPAPRLPARSLTAEQPEMSLEQRRLALYDVDGDGSLDSIERTIMKYDANADGSFSIAEVKAIIQDLKSAEKASVLDSPGRLSRPAWAGPLGRHLSCWRCHAHVPRRRREI